MPFDGNGRLRVVVLFSGGASGFRYLRDHDPNYGEAYAVVGGFTDDPDCPGVDAFEGAGIPVAANDIRAFYAERDADTGDMAVREAFDARTAELIGEFDPDVVLLSGYMWILTAPVIDAYPTINVHPGDLAIEDEDGERVYAGIDPVTDAITAGEVATRSTVHLVTSAVDAGPLLVRSKPFDVHRELVDALDAHGAADAIGEYADAHQEWMKWEGDGPAIATALELLATGRIDREGNVVEIDGERGIYDLGEDRVISG